MKERYLLNQGYMIVKMPKEIDHHCADELRSEMDLMMEKHHISHLIFDFEETTFMDSSGIGVIIGRTKNIGYSGGSVQAVHLNERVQKIFTMSGLHRLIPIVSEIELSETAKERNMTMGGSL